MRLLRRAALLSLVLLCAAVESPHWPPAAQATPPPTMHGVYRYRVRGLTAGAGLFSTMLFKVQGMGYATLHRVVPGFFKILSGMAKVSNDPSTKEMHDFLRSADQYGVDLSTIPVSAGYGVEIEFTLEAVKKEWRLKRGSYRWSSDHHFSVSAGEGSIVENVRGQGSGPLDPKTSSITLTTTGKKGDLRQELAGDIEITSGFTAGKSVFTNGPIKWAFDHSTGEMQIVLPGLASVRERLVEPGEKMSLGQISFSKGGAPEKVLKGMEVYQDLLDSGVVEEWELWSTCEASIKSPVEKDELVYNSENPGKIEQVAKAKVTPSFWGDAVRWTFPEIEDSKVEPKPENAAGDSVPYSYTGLPVKNSDFKSGDFATQFDSRATEAGCRGETRRVNFFFSREATNNPGEAVPPPGTSRSQPDPNWFYYWLQTKAAQGHGKQIRYGGGTDRCGPDDYGDYKLETDYITVCDLSNLGFTAFSELGMGPPREWHGIDAFGVTVRHEWQHYLDYRRWWGDEYGRYIPAFDTDHDRIPDKLEVEPPKGVEPPPPLNKRVGRFRPLKFDSALKGVGDEHTFAYAAEYGYVTGMANSEDWSCPGSHQASSEKCKEFYQVKRRNQ